MRLFPRIEALVDDLPVDVLKIYCHIVKVQHIFLCTTDESIVDTKVDDLKG